MSLVLISRKLAAAHGREAVAIVEAGAYIAPSGRTISIAAQVAAESRHPRKRNPICAC